MNLGEMRTLAWDWLDDPDGGYFTEPIMNKRLNLAMYEIQKRLLSANQNYYVKCALTSFINGQNQYVLPIDFYETLKVERITQGSCDTAVTDTLEKITMIEADLLDEEQGYPTHYWLEERVIRVWPVPNVTQQMRLKYSYLIPQMVNDTDIPNVPEQYQEYIPILAARDGFLKDGRDLAPINNKLEEYKELLKQISVQRVKSSPRNVVATNMGFGAV